MQVGGIREQPRDGDNQKKGRFHGLLRLCGQRRSSLWAEVVPGLPRLRLLVGQLFAFKHASDRFHDMRGMRRWDFADYVYEHMMDRYRVASIARRQMWAMVDAVVRCAGDSELARLFAVITGIRCEEEYHYKLAEHAISVAMRLVAKEDAGPSIARAEMTPVRGAEAADAVLAVLGDDLFHAHPVARWLEEVPTDGTVMLSRVLLEVAQHPVEVEE